MANTFSFDDSEFADSKGGDAADQAIADLEQSPEPESSEDPELADVDLRLATADYYRAILNHDFFNVATPAAEIVDREIRTFIRERLEVLLGLRGRDQAHQESLFDEDEVQALKMLAGKVLQKPSLVTSAPVVKKMATPAQSKVEVVRPMIRAKPLIRKIPAPAPAPSTKPRLKPVAVAQPAAPAAKPLAKKVKNKSTDSQTFIDHAGDEITLIEGETITDNGQRFLVARNEHGTLFRKNITGQVAAPNRLPPMSAQQMSLFSQQQALEQVGGLDELTGMAVAHSISQKE